MGGRVMPGLRFPEFRNSAEWAEEPFSKLYRFGPTNTFSRDQLSYTSGSVKNIHYGDIHTRFQPTFDIRREMVPYVSPDHLPGQLPDEALCREGDMVFADASEDVDDVGKSIEIVVLDGQQLVSGTHTILAKRLDPKLIVGFGAHLFCAPMVRARIRKESQGAKVLGISPTRLAGILIPFPSDPAEQRKIAECLTSLDELIAAEGRKLDALRAFKKGLLQNLFPREGETTPRLRFPEFRTAPSWSRLTLRDASPAIFDGTHQTPTYVEEGIPFYSVENLISGNANKFISEEDYVVATKYNKPGKGDVLLTRIGKIGYSQVVSWDHPFSVYVTLAVIKRSAKFDSEFLSQFMLSDLYQAELFKSSLHSAVPPKINMDDLRATSILLPEMAEQHRIASCLGSLDALITGQAKKLDTLKTHKQGLMQGLFPSPESKDA